MEYLVTMTTQVPEGTPEEAVVGIRAREAARAGELAAQGHLLRLWRPPLAPGEWRTLGLFAAADVDELERVLASMPLRVWRSDQVTPLSPHPYDPAESAEQAGPAEGKGPEFFTTFNVVVPDGTPDEMIDDTTGREGVRARELAGQGHLLRLWRLPDEAPGVWRALGLWRAGDAARMREIVASLPLYPWMSVEITPLTPHPSDPAGAGAGASQSG